MAIKVTQVKLDVLYSYTTVTKKYKRILAFTSNSKTEPIHVCTNKIKGIFNNKSKNTYPMLFKEKCESIHRNTNKTTSMIPNISLRKHRNKK